MIGRPSLHPCRQRRAVSRPDPSPTGATSRSDVNAAWMNAEPRADLGGCGPERIQTTTQTNGGALIGPVPSITGAQELRVPAGNRWPWILQGQLFSSSEMTSRPA